MASEPINLNKCKQDLDVSYERLHDPLPLLLTQEVEAGQLLLLQQEFTSEELTHGKRKSRYLQC